MVTEVSRPEDMSQNGYLRILLDDDGDVLIIAGESDHNGIISTAGVEFCEPSVGGGGSSATHAALRVLAIAMKVDNGDAVDREIANIYIRLLLQEIGNP